MQIVQISMAFPLPNKTTPAANHTPTLSEHHPPPAGPRRLHWRGFTSKARVMNEWDNVFLGVEKIK